MVQFACWYGGSSMLCLCLAFFPSSLYEPVKKYSFLGLLKKANRIVMLCNLCTGNLTFPLYLMCKVNFHVQNFLFFFLIFFLHAHAFSNSHACKCAIAGQLVLAAKQLLKRVNNKSKRKKMDVLQFLFVFLFSARFGQNTCFDVSFIKFLL